MGSRRCMLCSILQICIQIKMQVVTKMDVLRHICCRLQAKVWEMENRLGVQPKFRFPLFKPLLWNTASFYQSLVHKIVLSGMLA